jgi:hypothetical protein
MATTIFANISGPCASKDCVHFEVLETICAKYNATLDYGTCGSVHQFASTADTDGLFRLQTSDVDSFLAECEANGYRIDIIVKFDCDETRPSFHYEMAKRPHLSYDEIMCRIMNIEKDVQVRIDSYFKSKIVELKTLHDAVDRWKGRYAGTTLIKNKSAYKANYEAAHQKLVEYLEKLKREEFFTKCKRNLDAYPIKFWQAYNGKLTN